MAGRSGEITIRLFQDGDEKALSELFNASVSGFVGPAPTTPDSWRRMREVSWRSPVLGEDAECFRIAERGGEIVGYAVVECPCRMEPDVAVIQELCVAAAEDADEVARVLVADAEQFARARGASAIALHISHEDGLTGRMAGAAGYDPPQPGTGVFMAAVTNLPAFLIEIRAELTGRLASSRWSDWQGVIHLLSGDQSARLRIAGREVQLAGEEAEPILSVEIAPEALPSLLFGRVSVQQAFLQNQLSVSGGDRAEALAVLDALFPPLPVYLPCCQWW